MIKLNKRSAIEIKIHSEMAHSAVNEVPDEPEHVAYLHKRTGHIVFTWENREDTANVIGEAAADNHVAARRLIESEPTEWVAIPKLPQSWRADPEARWDAEEEHFYAFLAEHNINGVLV